jgi:hypothetical protein
MLFAVTTQNKSSYSICVESGRFMAPERERYGKPAVLVRCDRTCAEDNARGLKLAEKIAHFLNSLPESEQEALLADEMIPMNAKVG